MFHVESEKLREHNSIDTMCFLCIVKSVTFDSTRRLSSTYHNSHSVSPNTFVYVLRALPAFQVACLLLSIFLYLFVDVTEASVDADERCNRFETRNWGLPVAALVSTSELCFVESISSIDRLRPTIIVVFICLRGDGEEFFLLRACFRLLEVK